MGRTLKIRNTLRILTAMAGLLALLVVNGAETGKPGEAGGVGTGSGNDVSAVGALRNLPLTFEEAPFETSDGFQYVSRGAGFEFYLRPDRAVLMTEGRNESPVFCLDLVGAGPDARSEPEGPPAGKSNYFIGDDPKLWRTDVARYERIRYHGIYRGIDIVYYGDRRRLEFDFIVEPRTDPGQIRLSFTGAKGVEVDRAGDLMVRSDGGSMRLRRPVAYQDISGARENVPAGYTIDESGIVGIDLGFYDITRPLVIDPVIESSTYYGGSGTDIGYGIATDQQGNIYVTGQTSSSNFPLKNSLYNMLNGASDAFVMKLNPTGTTVIFATYLGGRNPGDKGWGVAVDKGGNIYLTGETNSLNFPVVNAFQPLFRGNTDTFVTKFNNQGNDIIYSTYLGGSLPDSGFDIALDEFDNACIAGRTDSSNFPVKNALQDALLGQRDAFVSKFDADGGLVFSTYLGSDPMLPGERDDEGAFSIALDQLNNIYLTGYTSSSGFPVVDGLQPQFGGVEDAFVVKIDSGGSGILYSTYIGGTRADNARGIAVDSYGNVYITGFTLSSDFPLHNALQPDYAGNIDGFVVKLDASGKKFIYSTYLGGSSEENTGLIIENVPSCSIDVDKFGNAYVTGKTHSMDFPTVRAIQADLRGDNDIYLTRIDPSGSELIFSTYLGTEFKGSTGFDERGVKISVNDFGTIYLTGQVLQGGFQTLFPAQPAYGGGLSDAFIMKLSAPDIPLLSPVSAASFAGEVYAPESIVAIFGTNLAGGIEVASDVPLPTSILGSSVTIRDSAGIDHPAPLFFVSPGQINLLIPKDVAIGPAKITATNAQNAVLGARIWIGEVAPGLFSANANGRGVPAAVLLRVKDDGSQSYEPVAFYDDTGMYLPLPIDLGPESDQIFLILFGTGIRGASSISGVKAKIDGIDSPVLYAGAQGGFVGQDQLNLQVPRSLARKGPVSLVLTIDGLIANQLTLNFQ